MKHLWPLLIICSSLCAQEAKEEAPAPQPINEMVRSLAGDNAAFGWRLFQQIRSQEGNLSFSPYSITSALVIPYVGAQGETREAMKKTLGFDQPSPELEQAFGAFDDYLTKHPTNYPQSFRILTANSLWIQERMRLLSDFLATVRRDFKGSVQRVDFITQTETSRGKINRWVAHQTNNKITDLIPKGFLNQSTRMVVASAFYLKANWMRPFPKNQTHMLPFFPSEAKTINVPMMFQTKNFPFLDQKNAWILEMPLEKPAPEAPELVMDFVLPKTKEGLKQLESELSISTLQAWFEKMENQMVAVTLPRFKISISLALEEALQKMGMEAAFNGKADFSGITGSRDLALSKVIHQTYIDVKESGVEAAAATAASMVLTSMPMDRPKEFKADHPFLFFLRDRETGAILFIGRVVDPR